MNLSELAYYGGKKIRTEYFKNQFEYLKNYSNAGSEFYFKLSKILDSRILSGYRGNYIEAFWGGKAVRKLEDNFINKILMCCPEEKSFLNRESKENWKSLAVNSCTSALMIACGAVGIQPGDEVIVTPWSMSCSATAPMWWGGIPIFCDIGDDYCIDPDKLEKLITKKTKAVIVVDLFGNIANYEKIIPICKKYDIKIIEDAAQAIGSYKKYKNDERRSAGFFGDIGCFSFTQGKRLTAGEGGMIVTKDEKLHMKCAAIRNHAEAVESSLTEKDIFSVGDYFDNNMLGLNLRLTEIQATIIELELDLLERKLISCNKNSSIISDFLLSNCDFVKQYKDETIYNSYYVLPFLFDEKKAGIKRDTFVDYIKAELMPEDNRDDRGILFGSGYIKPLYKMPLFKDSKHWSISNTNYKNVFCENAEKFYSEKLFLTLYQNLMLNSEDINDIIKTFDKVIKIIKERSFKLLNIG